MFKQVRDADLHLLRVFAAVAECGGLAAAQSRLNVAASTISTQLSNLEIRLGFRLCERGRAGFRLTDEGRVVLENAYKLFGDLGRFTDTLEALKGSLAGTLKLVVLDSSVNNPEMKLDTAIRLVKERQPFMQFEVCQLPPGELENAVLRRDVDLGIAWVSSKLPSLVLTSLFTEEQIICCGRGHPLFDAAPDGVDERVLEETDWVRRGYRIPRDFPFSVPPVSSAIAYQMESIVHFILAGTHIGFLPRHYVQQWISEDRIRPILPDIHGYKLPFHLVTRADTNDDRLIRELVDALLAVHGKAPQHQLSAAAS